MVGKLSSTNHTPSLQKILCAYSIIDFTLGLYGHYPSFIHHNLIRIIITTLQIRNVCFVYLWCVYTQVVCTCWVFCFIILLIPLR